MGFSREHFKLTADVIKDSGLSDKDKMNMAIDFSQAFNRENWKFNKSIFLKACGL